MKTIVGFIGRYIIPILLVIVGVALGARFDFNRLLDIVAPNRVVVQTSRPLSTICKV